MASSTSPSAALVSSSAAASSPVVRRSLRQRAAASTVIETPEWTVGIDALSPELLDRIVSEAVQGHKGPATRRLYVQLAEVNRAFADAALRRLWRRLVFDYGKKRSTGILKAFGEQPQRHSSIRRLLIRYDGTLSPERTTQAIDMLSKTQQTIELAMEVRLPTLSAAEAATLTSALAEMSLERLRVEPPLLDTDRLPGTLVRKYPLEPAFTSNFGAWTRLAELHLWQIELSVPERATTAVSYRLRVLSLRDVDASPAAMDHFFPSESVQSLDRLTLDYTCSLERDDEGRRAFGGSLARIVSVAAPALSYLSLMAPKDTFGDGEDQMVAALRRLGPTLRYLCVGGEAISHAHWTAVTQLATLSQVRQAELNYMIDVAPIAIVASLEDDGRWPMLRKLRVRRYEYFVRTGSHGIDPSRNWVWPSGPMRRLRHICEDRGCEELRFDERANLPDEAYTTDEAEATEDDEVERADDNALFQLNEDDLEDLENERRVDVEIAREMRARESSEGDDFLPSDGDEL